MHYPVLLGAQATVVALDGHDLNVPTPLPITRFTIAPAQRYDLVFRMPAQGGVQLVDADPLARPAGQHPLVQIGAAPAAAQAYPAYAPLFDMTRYGAPRADAWKLNDRVDTTFPMLLGNRLGLYDGQVTMTFTINGNVNPFVPPLLVKPGQRVRIHIDFLADNPGLWMDHCHVLRHAAKGMGVMIVYEGITTPFNIGDQPGNHPE